MKNSLAIVIVCALLSMVGYAQMLNISQNYISSEECKDVEVIDILVVPKIIEIQENITNNKTGKIDTVFSEITIYEKKETQKTIQKCVPILEKGQEKIYMKTEKVARQLTGDTLCTYNINDGGTNLEHRSEKFRGCRRSGEESASCQDLNNLGVEIPPCEVGP